MKIGIDVHGVINRRPDFFAKFTHALLDKGHEVFIITGSSLQPDLFAELGGYGVAWSEIFSITDHLLDSKERVLCWNGEHQPVFSEYTWNKTKAEYCSHKEIDFHIDDSKVYGKYFKNIRTGYVQFDDGVVNLLDIVLGI